MALDLIARAAAFAAQNAANQALAGAGAGPLDLFSNLPTRSISAGTSLLLTQGYTAAGKGGAVYVSDPTANAALATAHPRFCKADAAGRYFRLIGESVRVDQAGALGTAGANDQPAIQAAANYAAAVGIPSIELLPYHESWQPVFPGGAPNLFDGIHLTIKGNVALIGTPGSTTISLKGQGGVARTPTDGNDTWASGWLFYSGAGVTKSVIRDITVNGNLTFANVLTNSGANVYDKGMAIADWAAATPNMAYVEHRNLTLRNFAGEIWYMGGDLHACEVLVENLTLTGSPQSAWNAASLAKVTAINLQAGDSYQPAETISGMGHLYIGGRFFNGYSNSLITTESFNGAYPYNYPFFTEPYARWTEFRDMIFERCGTMLLGSRMKGTVNLVDTGLQFINYGVLQDVDLTVNATADTGGGGGGAAVTFGGLDTLTTQVPGAPTGTYYQKPRNIRLKIVGRQNQRAVTIGKYAAGIRLGSKLYDTATCTVEVIDEGWAFGRGLVDDIGYFSAGATPPRVIWSDDGLVTIGESSASPTADFSVDPGVTHIGLNPQAIGTLTMTLTNSRGWNWADGQKMRVYYDNGGAGKNIRMPASGYGYTLKETRMLARHSDYVDLQWDAYAATWVECGFKTSWVPLLYGSKAFDAPSLNSGDITTTTVTVSGAALGDYVTAVSFGVDLQGMEVWTNVSAPNTVSVSIGNWTASPINLASTTLSVEVRRKV
jgi:hypothetical protein